MGKRTLVVEFEASIADSMKCKQYLILTTDDTNKEARTCISLFERAIGCKLEENDKSVLDEYFDDMVQDIYDKFGGVVIGFYMAENTVQVGMYGELKLPAMPLKPIMTIHKGKRVYGKKLVN